MRWLDDSRANSGLYKYFFAKIIFISFSYDEDKEGCHIKRGSGLK